LSTSRETASTNLKPFQGLKLSIWLNAVDRGKGFNQPKTLSGIETKYFLGNIHLGRPCFNQPKTLSGIETGFHSDEKQFYGLLQPT